MKNKRSASLVRLLRGCALPLAYTPRQVAERLSLPRSRVDWLLATWRIRSVLFNGRRYITRTELTRAVEAKLR